MTNIDHNALSFKNEDLLQTTFSNFLKINSSLSIEKALDAFLANFDFFKFRVKNDAVLASKVINLAIQSI